MRGKELVRMAKNGVISGKTCSVTLSQSRKKQICFQNEMTQNACNNQGNPLWWKMIAWVSIKLMIFTNLLELSEQWSLWFFIQYLVVVIREVLVKQQFWQPEAADICLYEWLGGSAKRDNPNYQVCLQFYRLFYFCSCKQNAKRRI